MVEVLELGIGVTLTLIAVVLHLSKGTEWNPRENIVDDVLEYRASTVPETDFPEPMNRSIGGGAVGGAGGAAIAGESGAEAEGELEEGEAADESPASIPDDEAEVYEVEFLKEGETLEVKENTTLLEAGEEQGWDLPYACREGQCISCGGRITNGPAEDFVEHHTNQMLGEDELGDGYALTCVAYPTADLSLETGEAP